MFGGGVHEWINTTIYIKKRLLGQIHHFLPFLFLLYEEGSNSFMEEATARQHLGSWRLNHLHHCNLNFLVLKTVRNFWVFVLFYFSRLWYPVRAAENILSHQVFGIMSLRVPYSLLLPAVRHTCWANAWRKIQFWILFHTKAYLFLPSSFLSYLFPGLGLLLRGKGLQFYYNSGRVTLLLLAHW